MFNSPSVSLCRQARKLWRVVWKPLRGVRQGGLPVFLQGLALLQGHRGPQLLCRVPELAVAVRYVAGHHRGPPARSPRPHSQRWKTRGPAGRVHQTQKALRPLPGGQRTARIPHAASCLVLVAVGQVMNGVGVGLTHGHSGSRPLYLRTREILVLVHDVIRSPFLHWSQACSRSCIRKCKNPTSKQIS